MMRNLKHGGASWGRLLLVIASLLTSGCREIAAPREVEPKWLDVDTALPSNQWHYVPSLSADRTLMGVALIGKCAWSIGGYSGWINTSATDVVESICQTTPAPTHWTPQPSLPEPLANFAGVAAIGSRIYVAGGVSDNGQVHNSLYIYDPSTGWRLDGEPMPRAMACGAATVFAGKLYVHAPSLASDSAAWFFGGCEMETRDAFAVYDPSLPAPPRWRMLPPADFWYSRRVNPAMATIGRNLYLIGGTTLGVIGSGDVQVFDATLEQWFPDDQRPPEMYPGRGRLAVVAAQGRLYALGGFNGNISGAPGRFVSVYSPSLNTWDNITPLQQPHDGLGVVTAGNKIVAVGGSTTAVEWITLGTGPTACDMYEPDDVITKAGFWDVIDFSAFAGVAIGAAVTQAQLCSASDEDWFVLHTAGAIGNSVKIQLTPPPGADYQLEMWDLSGTTLLAQSAQPGSVPELVTYTGPLSPDHLLRVRSQNGAFSSTPYKMETVP